MKDYIIENQDLVGRHEFTQLELKVSQNKEIELQSRKQAEVMGLNFSKVLQNALMEQVGEQN